MLWFYEAGINAALKGLHSKRVKRRVGWIGVVYTSIFANLSERQIAFFIIVRRILVFLSPFNTSSSFS
jgi:hypothetical protein